MSLAFAELHCHSNFSFLDGASTVDDLAERAAELGYPALAITDHQGLYGAVRFASAMHEVGLRPIVGLEVELLDPAVPDALGVVVPRRRRKKTGPTKTAEQNQLTIEQPTTDKPRRPLLERQRPPGHRDPVREDLRGVRTRELGPHLVLLARDMTGYRSLCRLVERGQPGGHQGRAALPHALLEQHVEGLVALSGCRHGEIGRRLDGRRSRRRAGGRPSPGARPRTRLHVELQHHLLPDDDFAGVGAVGAGRRARPADRRHQRRPLRRGPTDRELQDVLVVHPPRLDARRERAPAPAERRVPPEGRGGAGCICRRPPARWARPSRRAWAEGMAVAGESAAALPGRPRVRAATASRASTCPRARRRSRELERLCHEGVRRRYHPVTPAVVKQLAHELEVIERTGLAEFFLICWDLMQFCRERGIPAQGRGSGRRFDRRLRAGHHPRRPHPPRAAVRALHQRGPDHATRTWTSTSPRRAARR